MKTTPISKITLDEREFFIKRDELIDPHLAGNKYRKLYTLLQAPKEQFDTIVSYGGTQSNAMLAIAKMCYDKNWKFIYYTKPLSAQQKKQKLGNYFDALNLGMNHIEIDYKLYRNFISSLRVTQNEKTFIIDQGGAIAEANEGVAVLADELKEQLSSNELQHIRSLATPSGTGTTAFFLAKHMPNYTVYTTPAIGDEIYLTQQMSALGEIPKNLKILKSAKKYRFAKPYKEFYEIYTKLLKATIEFDLLYAPAMWINLLTQTDEDILYIHSGGVSGNKSMLKRYQYAT